MMTVQININNEVFMSLKATRIEPVTELPDPWTVCKYRVDYREVEVGVVFVPFGDIYFLSEELVKFMRKEKKSIKEKYALHLMMMFEQEEKKYKEAKENNDRNEI